MWTAEQLRLSIFLGSPLPIGDNDWRALTGQPESQARINVPGGRSLTGTFAGGVLALGSVGNRADVILSPSADATAAEPGVSPRLPTIGEWDRVRDLFVPAVSSWMSGLDVAIVRVAFGGVLLLETESNQESYEKLKFFLKSVSVDAERMRELIYRINWPQRSKESDDININRITIWNALRLGSGVLQLTGGQVQASRIASESYAVRLEFDHSTDAERPNAIGKEKIQPIFAELVSLASENAAQGERP
jgi:hypothetical protein